MNERSVKDQWLEKIALFLKANNAHRANNSVEDLLPWLDWYWRDARVGVLRHEGEIVAVALVRLLEDLRQADQEWFTCEHGKIVWVDDIVSRHPNGIHFLLEIARGRFGPREAFAGQVFYRAGELRMLPWSTVERLAEKIRSTNEHQTAGPAGCT